MDDEAVYELFRYVDSNRERIVDDLKRLCKQPSVSAQGWGSEECADLVASMLEGSGIPAEVFKDHGGNPIVLGEVNMEAHKTLMFYNHYDVQPPEPYELWENDPFSPEVRGGKLYARGAADNKGNIIARIKAVEAFLKTFGEIPANVKFVIEGEEEIGSPSLPKFVNLHDELLFADGCVWEFGYKDRNERPTITLGVKGILYVELEVRGPSRDLHSSMGAIIPNPAWRLVRALSSMVNDEGECVIDGFYDDVIEPSDEELDLLKSVPFDEESLKKDVGIKRFVRGLSGIDLLVNQYLRPACNVNGIVAGYTGKGSKTVLPSWARAKVDFRLVPNQRPEVVLNKLKSHLEARGFNDVSIAYSEHGYPPARTPPASPMVRLVTDTAKEAYKKEPVVYPTTAASGPMYLFTEKLKLHTVSTGVGYWGSNTHSPNENIRIDDLIEGVKHVILMMLKVHSYL